MCSSRKQIRSEALQANSQCGLCRRKLQGELLAALLLCQSQEALGGPTTPEAPNPAQEEPLDLTVTDKVPVFLQTASLQVQSYLSTA